MMNKKYKCSAFNYCSEKSKSYIIYNTLYNTLVRLKANEYLQYIGENECNEKLLNELVQNGLWVETDIDEKKRYLSCARAYNLYIDRPINITITPTMKCNARCAYCYEKGIHQTDMIKNAEDKLVRFIKESGNKNEIHINWFGGEPLLNTKFIDSFSEKLIEEGIKYSSYIITNGSKINDEILNKKLELWNVHEMQITLDGTKNQYEKRKNYINEHEGEFYTILNNIRLLAEKNIYIHIRLNIERDNKQDILKLLKEIDLIFGKYENVVFYPAFITGSENPLDEDEKVEYIKDMMNIVSNVKKLTAGTKFYSYPRIHSCMYNDPKSFSIDVNGNIYRCEHLLGKSQESMGNLDSGFIKDDQRGKENLLRKECEDCVFLPKCLGGCEANFNDGDIPCMIEKYIIKAYVALL